LDIVWEIVSKLDNLYKLLMETSSPALQLAIIVLLTLFILTGLGVYTAFGPPAKGLEDPWDAHDD